MPDAIDDLKESVKTSLRLEEADAKQLDESFASVSRGFSPVVTVLVIIGAVVAVAYGQTWIAVIAVIAIIGDWFTKLAFDRSRLQVIARTACRYTCKTQLARIQNCVGAIPLSSLRASSWQTNFSIVFPSNNGINFSYRLASNTMVPSEGGQNFDASRLAIELCPGVFAQYHSVYVSLKCDFRVIRTPMTQQEVATIFRSIADVLPTVPAEGISIRQHSSTKTFLFEQNYIDSGTISYIKTRSSQRNLNITNDKPRVTRQSAAPPQIAQAKSGQGHVKEVDKQLGSAATRLKRSLLLLSDLVEKRKDIELRAMYIAMAYETSEGRSVKDVSSQNLGFDVLSQHAQGGTRRIEVKGLAGVGDVILTENEMRATDQFRESYWLYVVENCLNADKTVLYTIQYPSSSDVRPQAVAYEIDLIQQNSSADEIIRIGSNNKAYTGANSNG